nr:hypothetical protein [uncultured Flavobacterium sp.]
MSEEKKAMLANQNWVSMRNMNDNQIRKYSSTAITPLKISFTKQKIVLLIDAIYKVASFSGGFIYKDISTNKKLYEIVGNYFDNVLQNESHFPSYDDFQVHSNLVIDELYKKLIGPDDAFRNQIHS